MSFTKIFAKEGSRFNFGLSNRKRKLTAEKPFARSTPFSLFLSLNIILTGLVTETQLTPVEKLSSYR